MTAVIHHGDCLDVLRDMADNSVDAVVTDPPAGIAFMSKAWDGDKGGREQWSAWLADVMREALRVTKPGGHALVWALPRTSHWTACGLEDAGWEIRDRISHLFGSGFPKSLDVSKAIDKAAGATREVVGHADPSDPRTAMARGIYGTELQEGPGAGIPITAAATPAAKKWQGWGTALKPGAEDWWVARKPLGGRTVAANVLEWGTGALNVDGCRVGTSGGMTKGTAKGNGDGWTGNRPTGVWTDNGGRWPTNVVLDGSQADALDEEVGTLTSGKLLPHHADNGKEAGILGAMPGYPGRESYGDSGGPSRFFPTFRYQAKAPTRERPHYIDANGVKQAHATVKPLALMRWLVRLVTPPGGVVLDPFAGSGTTIEAAILEGFRVIGIEREADYLPLIEARIARATPTQEPSTAAAEALALFDLEEPA